MGGREVHLEGYETAAADLVQGCLCSRKHAYCGWEAGGRAHSMAVLHVCCMALSACIMLMVSIDV